MSAGDLAVLAAAVMACIGAGALAFARSRLAMALAFAVACMFAGISILAGGLFEAGAVVIAAGLLAALFALASGAALGEMLTLALRPAPLSIAAIAVCAGMLLLAWPNAPPLPVQASPPAGDVTAFDTPRGGDLLIALAAFAAVGAAVLALIGFGARGLFGPDRDGAS